MRETTGGLPQSRLKDTYEKECEEAVKAAILNTQFSVFTFTGGYNAVWRPRVRGAWCVIVLASEGKWAYESILAKLKHTGRLRP